MGIGGLMLAGAAGGARAPAPARLTVGVVQKRCEATLEANRDSILGFIAAAKAKGCRVVVFPEGALHWPDPTPKAVVETAIEAIRAAADREDLYVLLGLKYRRTETEKPFNRLLVLDPDGKARQTYDKLWSDARFNDAPGPFDIDGIPCGAAICADRWIRSVEELPAMAGAKILFECSANYANEWIPDLEWYWYVPRAVRNGVYVVFANMGRDNPGATTGHGHSAVIAPDGSRLAALGEENDRLLVATLDLEKATGAAARERREHPVFRPFWEAGVKLLAGEKVSAPAFPALTSPKVPLRLAAAQVACSRDLQANVARMARMVREAAAGGADLVAFPELAVTGADAQDVLAPSPATLETALAQMEEAARAAGITVVFGMPSRDGERRRNSAFVLGPDGTLLTRYDQLAPDQPDLFRAGTSTAAMWFRVKGVAAVVTLGSDARWSELGELPALRGAQVHVHLAYDRETTMEGTLRRRQFWANLASYRTFTLTVNAASPAGVPRPSRPANGGSCLWEDFRRAKSGPAGGYAPHSAVRLAQAGAGETMLFATQTVPEKNPQFGIVTGKTNPQMAPWYATGARIIGAE